MARRFDTPPTADEIAVLARASLAALPPPFAAHLGNIVVRVEELADEETLGALGIDHPLDLTGLYEGVPIGDKEGAAPGTMPDRVTLYRQAILDEWITDGEVLETLVHHILVHEVGHHFGLSDEDMHLLEGTA